MCSVTPSQLRTTVEQIPDTSSFSKDTELTEPVKARVRVCLLHLKHVPVSPAVRVAHVPCLNLHMWTNVCLSSKPNTHTHTPQQRMARLGSLQRPSLLQLFSSLMLLPFWEGGKKEKLDSNFFILKIQNHHSRRWKCPQVSWLVLSAVRLTYTRTHILNRDICGAFCQQQRFWGWLWQRHFAC